MMIARILFSVAAMCSLAIAMGGAEKKPITSRSGIELEFEDEAVLTEAQIEDVRKLALECGLPSVRKIYTYNIHPSSAYGIGALSRDTVVGREFTNTCVLIDYDKWNPYGRKGKKILKQRGDFWVRDEVIVSRGAAFATRRGEIRVGLDEHTPLAFADRVVAAMEARPLRFKDDGLKQRIEKRRADITRPIGIYEGEDGKCLIGVSLGTRLAGMTLECVFDGDGGLTVVEVSTWVS